MELEREDLYYCNLISRRIIGELNADEKASLAGWIKSSPHNRELYGRFTDRRAVIQRFEMYGDIPVHLYLGRMMSYVNETKKSGAKQYGRIVSWIVAVIAALCAACLVFDSFRCRFSADASAAIASQEVIHPGSRKAVLVLDDGRSVQLKPDMEGYLKEFGDTGIRIKGNSIDYTGVEVSGQPASLHKIIVPTGGEYLTVLGDGSRVYLNSESVLVYPVSFGGGRREVRLEGEGYFEIAAEPDRPFVVRSGNMTVTAVGTEFNMRAYADEDYAAATLIAGQAQVAAAHTETAALTAPQQAVAFAGRGGIIVTEVDTRPYRGLKDGEFVFSGTRLEEIVDAIRRWYGFAAVLDEKAKDEIFTCRIDRRQSVYSFLQMLETTGMIRAAVDKKVITFTHYSRN